MLLHSGNNGICLILPGLEANCTNPLQIFDNKEYYYAKTLLETKVNLRDCTIIALDTSRKTLFNSTPFQTKKRGMAENAPLRLDQFISRRYAQGIELLFSLLKNLSCRVLVPMGEEALFALTLNRNIGSYRGSLSYYNDIPVIPTYDPYIVNRKREWGIVMLHDFHRIENILLKGAPKEPEYDFNHSPTADEVFQELDQLLVSADRGDSPITIACDIENDAYGITEFGIAFGPTRALCVPFVDGDGTVPYWDLDDEVAIVRRLQRILDHPNIHVAGQGWLYDAQWIARQWGVLSVAKYDTMIMHHALYSCFQKSLDFLASLYCDYYVYWKSERVVPDLVTHRKYNCKDCVYTWEVLDGIAKTAKRQKMERVVKDQMDLFEPVLTMMIRGVRLDRELQSKLRIETDEKIKNRKAKLMRLLGHELNINSPPQLQALFYHDFQLPKQYVKRGKGAKTVSTNNDSLTKLKKVNRLVAPVVDLILEVKDLQAIHKITKLEVDDDYRVRCRYEIPGTDTYRFKSKKDAFGKGTNLQNVTEGNEAEGGLTPNLRRAFIPDPGKLIVDPDLPQADARVVAWEADDEPLMEIFLDPDRDLHTENAKTIFGACDGKGDPRRQAAKQGVHAANYLVSAWTLARTLHISVSEAEYFLEKWFLAHPRIQEWQDYVYNQLVDRRYVQNRFGYRMYYFDRPDQTIKQALAAIPQSTVARIVNIGMQRVHHELREVDVLLQTHDDVAMQFPAGSPEEIDYYMGEIRDRFIVEVPYDRKYPLAMVPDLKYGPNCGDLKPYKK